MFIDGCFIRHDGREEGISLGLPGEVMARISHVEVDYRYLEDMAWISVEFRNGYWFKIPVPHALHLPVGALTMMSALNTGVNRDLQATGRWESDYYINLHKFW